MKMKSITFFSIAALSIASVTIANANAEEISNRVIRFGHLNNTDHPVSAGVRKFAEIVAQKSGGKMQVKEYPSNQLGSEQQQTSALRGGVQEMQSPATISIVGLAKDLGVIDFPFVLRTHEQAFELLDGPLGTALFEKLPEKGLIGLAYWNLGFRNVTNSKRPVFKYEDMSGLKLRVIPNPVFLEVFGALGTTPVPLSSSDVYTALETKAVDGQENPFSVILSNKYFEVQKYVSATNHVYSANIILISKVFWDKLSATEQKILREAAIEARDYQRKVSVEAAIAAIEQLKKAGMEYNEITLAELERMRAAVKPVIDKFMVTYDPAIQKLYAEEITRILKK